MCVCVGVCDREREQSHQGDFSLKGNNDFQHLFIIGLMLLMQLIITVRCLLRA